MKEHVVYKHHDKWEYLITTNNWISPLIKGCSEWSLRKINLSLEGGRNTRPQENLEKKYSYINGVGNMVIQHKECIITDQWDQWLSVILSGEKAIYSNTVKMEVAS